MRWTALVLAAACVPAACGDVEPECCRDGAGAPRVDAGLCLSPADRTFDCAFDLTGRVLDVTNGDLVPGGRVALTTAFDTSRAFPADNCVLLDEVPVGDDGEFVRIGAPCDAPDSDPFMLAKLHHDGYAQVAMHRQIICPVAECTSWDLELQAPRRPVFEAWLDEAIADGMSTFDGLILVRFVEADGTPSEGVTALFGQRNEPFGALFAPEDVRYISADGVTLMPTDTQATTASGLALVSPSRFAAPFGFAIGGSREGPFAEWELASYVTAQGWLYFAESGRIR